jgi:hypothetical protein
MFSCQGDGNYNGSVCDRDCNLNGTAYTCNSYSNNLGAGSTLLNSTLNTTGPNTKDWNIVCSY